MAKTAAQVAAKWSARLSQAGEQIRQGVQDVTVAPSQSAIDAKDRYLSGVTAAFNDGRYVRGLQKISLEDWKTAMLGKGIQRVAQGAQAAIPKVQAFQEKWLPIMAEGSRRVNAMPKGDVGASQARAAFMIAYAAGFKGKVT